jgi:hypothetical protein
MAKSAPTANDRRTCTPEQHDADGARQQGGTGEQQGQRQHELLGIAYLEDAQQGLNRRMNEDPLRRGENRQERQDCANADHLGKRRKYREEHEQGELKPPTL